MADNQPPRADRASWDPAGTHQGIFPGWIIVAICFLSLNFSVGIVFTGYNPLTTEIEREFQTSRMLASSGPPIASIALGIVALFVGNLIVRFGARTVLVCGNLMVMAGFLLASIADNIYVLLAIYGTLIGAGFVAMGIVTCSTLVTRWFNARRGLALGIINLFPGMVFFPWATTWVLVEFDLRTVFLANAAMFALLLPFLLLIRERPEDRGLAPLGGTAEPPVSGAAPVAPSNRELFADPNFWMLSLGIALLTGAANIVSGQTMPMLEDHNVSKMDAAEVMMIYGAAIAFIAPAYGLVIDRIGPLRSLFVQLAIFVPAWIVLTLITPGLGLFVAVVFAIGIGSGGIVTLHTSNAARLVRPALFSKAMGIGYFIKMPFLLLSSPLAARVHDLTGSYHLALIGGVVMILLAGALFTALCLRLRADGANLPTSKGLST